VRNAEHKAPHGISDSLGLKVEAPKGKDYDTLDTNYRIFEKLFIYFINYLQII
jgi:hypothetical protein